ncbi:MAG: hypothetical protein HYZ53_13130 [Planctomycetes bacterium]|nr:hypothetical protein [Planctomycetota bacterium]
MAAASMAAGKAARAFAGFARLVTLALYRWGMAVAVVGGVAWLLLLVHRKVYDHLLHEERYQVDARSLAVLSRPQWAGKGLDFSVGELPFAGKVSIFQADLTERVAEFYKRNPWVARVVRIRKELPNRLRIQLEIRRPVASVEQKGNYYLVDRESVRLPGKYSRTPDVRFYIPVVVGVVSAPADPGQPWHDPAVEAGVAVAQSVIDYDLSKDVGLIAIDVENVEGRKNARDSEIVIWAEDVLKNLVPIQWGRSPVTEKFGEVPVDLKMKNLRLVLMACPKLHGIQTVKIQFQRPYVVTRDR